MRSLPLVFGLVLAGGLLVEHGAKLFGATFAGLGGDGGATADPAPDTHSSDAGLTPNADSTGGIGKVTGQLLTSEGGKYGWSGVELSSWKQLLGLESGGDPAALGPTVSSAKAVSGVPGGGKRAFGVGQFLGSTLQEYLPYGAGSSDVDSQLSAMARYIHDRYGSPSAALAFHRTHNWY